MAQTRQERWPRGTPRRLPPAAPAAGLWGGVLWCETAERYCMWWILPGVHSANSHLQLKSSTVKLKPLTWPQVSWPQKLFPSGLSRSTSWRTSAY